MDDYLERRNKAKKKVEEIKGFYTHLRVYLIVNIILLVLRSQILDYFAGRTAETDPGFFDWIDANAFFTPLFWGIGLAVHGICVYRDKFPFIRQWEERQIRKYMEEEDSNRNKYN